MERRLAAIDAEMRELEVLRVHLGVLREHGPRPGSSVHVTKKTNKTSKRRRDATPPTVFYPLSRRVCGVPAMLLKPPLFEAAAYIRGAVPNVRHAPLPLSPEEQRQREVDYLFSARVSCRRPSTIAPAALDRLRNALADAGLSGDDSSATTVFPRRGIKWRAPLSTRDLQALCDAVPREQLRAVCRGEAGDPVTLAASLYALVCEAAALRTLVAPELRRRNVALLQLPNSRAHDMRVVDWTLRYCCECRDRDLMANTHIQRLKTLQSLSTAPAAGAVRDSQAYAVAYAQLADPLTTDKPLVLTAKALTTVCGGTFAELEAKTSRLWSQAEVLPLREAVTAALTDGGAS